MYMSGCVSVGGRGGGGGVPLHPGLDMRSGSSTTADSELFAFKVWHFGRGLAFAAAKDAQNLAAEFQSFKVGPTHALSYESMGGDLSFPGASVESRLNRSSWYQ